MIKEIERIDKDKIVIEDQKEVKKQLKHLGSTILKPGHTLFEVNTKTFEIRKAEYSVRDISYKYPNNVHRTLIVKEDCIYIGSLNEENVARKLLKRLIK